MSADCIISEAQRVTGQDFVLPLIRLILKKETGYNTVAGLSDATDLDPYYERAQKKLELGPYDYTMAFWQKKDPALMPLVSQSSVIWNKIWQFSPPTRFGEKYKNDIVQSRNIHLYTYANVVKILTNEEGSSVQELIVKNLEGKQHRVRAKKFILACCAIQNARLLLASNQQFPKGLGNENDLVGRFFMEHLEIKSCRALVNETGPTEIICICFWCYKGQGRIGDSCKKTGRI